MTIIYEMTRIHAGHGRRTRIVVARGTRHDYPVGECIEVQPAHRASKRRKAADAVLGRLRLPRVFGREAYRSACDAMPKGFDGLIFIHNDPVAIPLFRQEHPAARVCLWANNELFRTYCDRETQGIVRAADRVICCSEYVAGDLRGRLGGSQDLGKKIRVVHNGADIERFRPDTGKRMSGVPIVLFVGRVIPEKGPDLLLKAAGKLYGGGRRFIVRIVGSSGFSATDRLTPYEEELRRLAAPMGDAVVFQPFVDRARVVDEYQAASIFCAPSTWNEPVSLTVPEALASGLATIASRKGGIPEVGGQAILYFDPPDADMLAAHLGMLLDNVELRQTWGHRAREQAHLVSWERQYKILVESLL